MQLRNKIHEIKKFPNILYDKMQLFSFIHFFFSVRKSSKRAKTGQKMVEIPLFTPGGQVKKMQVKSKRCWEGLMAHMDRPKVHKSGPKVHRGGLKAHLLI